MSMSSLCTPHQNFEQYDSKNDETAHPSSSSAHASRAYPERVLHRRTLAIAGCQTCEILEDDALTRASVTEVVCGLCLIGALMLFIGATSLAGVALARFIF